MIDVTVLRVWGGYLLHFAYSLRLAVFNIKAGIGLLFCFLYVNKVLGQRACTVTSACSVFTFAFVFNIMT